MNDRIKQLTLTYFSNITCISTEKKEKMLQINSQSEWIIFNAGSLKSRELNYYNSYRKTFLGENGKYSSETYDIINPTLRDIFKEVVKIYGDDDLDRNNIKVEFSQFTGGSGDFERAGQVVKKHAVPLATRGNGKGDSDYWVAVNKKVSGEDFETVFMNGDLCFNNDRRHWKTEKNLNALLNDNDITNSRERERERERERDENNTSSPDDPTAGTNSTQPPQTPPSFSATQSVQFTLSKAQRIFPDFDLFWLEASPSFNVNGQAITGITIEGGQVGNLLQNGGLQAGNTITITDIQFEPGRASIVNQNEIWISGYFTDIRVVAQTTGSPPPTSPPPNNPSFFPEVQRKNQDLANEENDFFLLVEKLLEVIEKNEKNVQEAQKLGLNLSKFPTDILNYFQEEFFALLDETKPLNDSHNQQINAENEKIRQKKENVKQNIYRIYKNNEKKLVAAKTGQTPPKSELEKSKEEVREKINKVLTDKDNLLNINLTTLANGKYQNWEKEIEKLTTPNEVVAYGQAFLNILEKVGIQEKKREEKEKNNKISTDNPPIPPKINSVDQDFKNKMANLPLATVKNIAKKKIRELFKKYQPDIEKIKECWQGEKSWMTFLEKCDDSKKVIKFLEKLEQTIIQQSRADQNQSKDKNENLIPLIIMISLIVVVMLISLVIAFRSKAVKKKKKDSFKN